MMARALASDKWKAWLPAAVLVFGLAMTALGTAILAANDKAHIDTLIAGELADLSSRFNNRLERKAHEIAQFGAHQLRVADEVVPTSRQNAESQFQSSPSLQALIWHDRVSQADAIFGRDDAARGAIGDVFAQAIADVPPEDLPLRLDATEFQYVKLGDGQVVLLMLAPVGGERDEGGTVVGLFDVEQLLNEILASLPLTNFGAAVFYADAVPIDTAATLPSAAQKWAQDARIDLGGLTLTLRVWPGPALIDTLPGRAEQILLLSGIVLSLLMATLTGLAQRNGARAARLDALNRDLRHEIARHEATEQELSRSNRELEQFAYVASHDLQEPLRMVSSYCQLLDQRYAETLDDDGREFLAYASDGAKRMHVLINDLLAYSRAGTAGRELAWLDSADAVENACANLQNAIESSGAKVTHEELPRIFADGQNMSQLFQNLIGNALKYCQEAAPRIHITAEHSGNFWTFAVRDNGIGIDPQYAERIFLMFQRLHDRNTYSGTGIGLAICKKIVERYGGRIWVDSKPGNGATFYFTIPYQGESSHDNEQLRTADRDSPGRGFARRRPAHPGSAERGQSAQPVAHSI